MILWDKMSSAVGKGPLLLVKEKNESCALKIMHTYFSFTNKNSKTFLLICLTETETEDLSVTSGNYFTIKFF